MTRAWSRTPTEMDFVCLCLCNQFFGSSTYHYKTAFKLARYIISLKEEQSWLPSHEILNAVLQRKILPNVALQLPIHKGRFIHWSDNHFGCWDQVEQSRGSELSKRDKQTFCECIRAGKGEKTLIWMLPLSEGEGFTAQFSARCPRLFNWYDTSWKWAAALIGSYLSNNQLKGRTWRVNTIFTTHRPYLLAHIPNSLHGGEGERKERGKKKGEMCQDQAATNPAEHSNPPPCTGQPDGGWQQGLLLYRGNATKERLAFSLYGPKTRMKG